MAPSEGVPLQGVRFASKNEEIEPSLSLPSASQIPDKASSDQQIDPKTEDEIRKLASGLHSSHIQQRRMSNFRFEPCSLPASRVPSNESTPYQTSREPTTSGGPSPKTTPPASAMTTPFLSPQETHSAHDKEASEKAESTREHPEIPPPGPKTQISKGLPQATGEPPSSSVSASQPSTGDYDSTRPTSLSQESNSNDVHAKEDGQFSRGPSGSSSSQSRSRGTSPAERGRGSAASQAGLPRPLTPMGDKDDPYARNKRPAQTKNLETIDARFKFGSSDSRRRSGINFSSAEVSSSQPSTSGGKDTKSEHRKSAFSLLGGKDNHTGEDKHDRHEKHHGSMSDLKRFFGIGSHHHKTKRSASPAASLRGSVDKKSGIKTPPRHGSSIAVPFADDHGLEKKYGKFNKILGSGAGGSVKLLKRSSDGRTFAVKQFRDRHNYESQRDYNKKVTAEFCIGSTLHHGNIIETLDIIQEAGHWFEVMEYAPFDLFAIVMTGKMTREEVTCCFLQIVNGVAFLHGSGLAHRDLKLDNVVVNENGIMKIIDFGSASVFKYPFETDIILASGVVGSDPYLAPEVYDERKYDPQPADVWSLAIIFACMTLRRFPWKAPRLSDNSFKMFVAEPHTNPEDILQKELAGKERAKSTATSPQIAAERKSSAEHGSDQSHHHHHHHHHPEKREDDSSAKVGDTARNSVAAPANRADGSKGEVIRGPWRLLRLLPRETRSIMGAMLKTDPKQRATLDEIMADPWISNAAVCQQLEHGDVLRAGTHPHVLEPGSSTPAPSAKQ
ncbi:uncharacterized protein KY384_007653 [Bacidia gigantensis]|uniref:uncharacterized protein n=1 Tax=Bacidia gigantensis TaxID=2732470 RepID=UPI001D0423F4|nr:uncharacterized protein KY384_007653 [Bacidia gigantensis]KAG8527501.1 hypothetical protein KY384_007653 [Bacidia gigantensis]